MQALHVAKDGVRPAAGEFADDAREPKTVARAMLAMVLEINDRLLPATGRNRRALALVTCATCHRGIARPVALETDLEGTYHRAGLDSTIARCRALRTQFYGGAAYDFSDITLPTLADRLAESALQRGDALALLRLNLEFAPDSWFTYQQMGQLQAVMGDTAAAIAAVERALSLNPQRAFLRELLARLRGAPGRPSAQALRDRDDLA